MRELYSEIEIEAAAERVWRLLTDFDRYPQWNPFIRRISGRPEPHTKLKVFIQPSGTRGMSFNPTVLKAEPDRELRWLGHLLISGLFDGEHIFIIEPIAENKVRFIQREKFSGLLVPLFWSGLDRETRRGFDDMNAALKKLAEGAKYRLSRDHVDERSGLGSVSTGPITNAPCSVEVRALDKLTKVSNPSGDHK